MKSHSRVVVLAFVTVGQFAAVSVRAQAADSLTKGKADGSIATAPVDTTHKKHGMFGKLKGLAQNKTVQSIGKAAICQAVPGGQYMMGAAEAAKNKTSIASGVVNAGSCIPGMPGGSPLSGKGGLAGVGAASALGALSSGASGKGAAQAAAMGGMARGIPGGGATAQTMAGMATAMQQMQAAQITMGGTAGMTTEAPGEQIKLSGQVADEIKKGKLVIKKIDWVHGAPTVSPSTMQGFLDVMMSVGQAIKAAGGNYRVDVYMDKKYSDDDRASIGVQRMTFVEASLQSSGPAPGSIVVGKVDKDKEQRIEIVREK